VVQDDLRHKNEQLLFDFKREDCIFLSLVYNCGIPSSVKIQIQDMQNNCAAIKSRIYKNIYMNAQSRVNHVEKQRNDRTCRLFKKQTPR